MLAEATTLRCFPCRRNLCRKAKFIFSWFLSQMDMFLKISNAVLMFFCYPQELDRRPCHWVSGWPTFLLYSFTQATCEPWTIDWLVLTVSWWHWALGDDIGIDYLSLGSTITNNQTLPSQLAVAGENICSSWL